MELEITNKTKNPMFGREELKFEIKGAQATPSKEDIRKKLAALCNTNEENILVNQVSSPFGEKKTVGNASIYPSKEKMKEIEAKYKIKRNFGEEKKEEAKSDEGATEEAPKEEPKTEEKKE